MYILTDRSRPVVHVHLEVSRLGGRRRGRCTFRRVLQLFERFVDDLEYWQTEGT